MSFSIIKLYTLMGSKKAITLLKKLPSKLNQFYKKNSKIGLVVNNKSKKNEDFNPVTNLDISFEILIRSIIKKKFPKDGIIGEEFREKKSINNFTWSIDPIDGTKAFVSGKNTWSNLIGYSYKKTPIMGLANFPKLKKYYITDKKKTYLFKNKIKKQIKASNIYDFKNIRIIGSFHNKKNNTMKKKLKSQFGNSINFFTFDALSYCLLAEGKIDVVIEDNLKPYDILPLIPIIKNSGGIITNWKNKSADKGGNILATSNKLLHSHILKVIRYIIK